MNSIFHKFSGLVHSWVIAGLMAILMTLSAFAAPGDVETGFNPDANNSVRCTAVQADGKILIAGDFTTVGGTNRNRVARLHEDGTLDASFDPAGLPENAAVWSMVVQGDGKIIVGGSFATVNGYMSYIARLNKDGTYDFGFNPVPNDAVLSMAVQPDGKILIAGAFTTVGGVARNYIARLNPDGTLDGAFNPNVDGIVYPWVHSMSLQAWDEKIVIGGWFTSVGGINRNYIARLNTDGTLDLGFNPQVNGFAVYSTAPQTDGKIVIGGNFTNVAGMGRTNIARLNPNGTLDTSFSPNAYANDTVQHLTLQWGVYIILGGNFTEISGEGRTNIARLNPDGTIDLNFNPQVNGFAVYSAALQTDGKIIIGGNFTAVSGTNRNNSARLDLNGSLDRGFIEHVTGVHCRAVLPDGKMLVGGSFYPGPGRAIALLNPDGDWVGFLNTPANGRILTLAVQMDEKIIITGDFTSLDGVARTNIARLNTDGTVDTNFNPSVSGSVSGTTLLADGKIIIWGWFTAVDGISRNHLARLNTDGTLDGSFAPQVNGWITSAAVQGSDQLIIGGQFTSSSGNGLTNYVARLNSSGTLDASFNSYNAVYSNSFVEGLAVQADGKVIISRVNPDPIFHPPPTLLRLNANGSEDASFIWKSGFYSGIAIQTDGKIIIGSDFAYFSGTGPTNIARYNSDGTVDTGFNPLIGGAYPAAAIQADGKVVVAGVRLFNDPATQSLTVPSASRVEWLRGGASPEALDVAFQLSTNRGTTWTALGVGTRLPGGWELGGLSLPTSGLVRARARVLTVGRIFPENINTTSSGVVESVVAFPPDAPPTVANPIADFAVNEDAPNTVIDLRAVFQDIETADADLVYSVQGNSNPTLLSTVVNNYSTDVLTLACQANQFGSATITVRAAATGGRYVDDTFVVTVNPVNDRPSMNYRTNTVVVSGSGTSSLIGFATFNAGPSNESDQRVAGYTLSNNSNELFSVQPTIDTSGNLAFNTTINAGMATVTVVVQDDGGTANGGEDKRTNTFAIVVFQSQQANIPPAVENPVPDFAVNEDAADTVIELQAVFEDFMTADADLVYQIASNSNPGAVSVTVNNTTDTLTLHYKNNQHGPAIITVRASDYYWAYAEDTFVVTVNPVNDAPVLALGANVAVVEDAGVQSLPGFVAFSPGPVDETAQTLLGCTVNNNSNALFSVQPAINNAGLLTFTPAAHANGSAVVTVIGQDSGGAANGGVDTSTPKTFMITVTAVNDAPVVLCASNNVVVIEDVGAQSLSGFANLLPSPADEIAQTLLGYTVNNNNNALFSVQPAINNVGLLVFTPATNANGSAIVTVIAQDNGGTANGGVDKATNSFTITVTAVNDVPNVTFATNSVVVPVASPAQTFSSFASFTPGPANESAQALVGYTVSNNSNLLFSAQPQINNSGTLTFTPAANTNGSAIVTVAVQDSGGTANGGVDTSIKTFTITVTSAFPGGVDPSFNPGANSSISSTAMQVDGKIVIGGDFTTVGGLTRNRIARLNADGAMDSGFNPSANGSVACTAVQADGKIVVGGVFTTVGGVVRNRIARLNADATLDTGFNPNANSSVFSMAVQADGKIIIGGFFTTVGGVARNRIARLNADGTLDTGFNPNAGNRVDSVAMQTDGKIVIGGAFTSVGGVARNRIARLNADGTLDTSFNPDANDEVLGTSVQADGKLVIEGTFTAVGGVTRNFLARLNSDGTLDTGFNPNANGYVYGAALQSDGKIVIGGSFTTLGGVARNGIARLNADGTLDSGFNPNADSSVYSLGLQSDGKIVIGGGFTTLGGVARNCIARLVNDAATQSLTVPDATRVQWLRGGTAPEAQDVTFDLSTDLGGSWMAAGTGTRVPGGWELTGLSLPASGLVRGRARVTGGQYNGSCGLVETVSAFPSNTAPTVANSIADFTVNEDAPDTVIDLRTVFEDSETPDASLVYSLRVNSNPTLVSATVNNTSDTLTLQYQANQYGTAWIVVRATDQVGLSVEDSFIVTVNPVQEGDPGDVDPSFNPSANSSIGSTAMQTDGKIVIGGFFTTVGGVARNRIARLNVDGTLDTGFNPNANNYANCMGLQVDGKIVIGGGFTTVGGVARNRIARLNSDGTLDAGFNPNANSDIDSTVVQADGKIIIGGSFSTLGAVARNFIARLNSDGTLDTGFNPNATGGVKCMALQVDGKIVIGGGFATVGGVARNRLARLSADGTLDTGFNPNANGWVYGLGLQSDGKVVVGGDFTTMGGVARNKIARLNADGTLDTGFSPNVGGSYVNNVIVQADGKLLISGFFDIVGGVARNYLARLNADGTLDAGFNPNVGTGSVSSTAVQADGQIVIGGTFTNVAGVPHIRIARLANDAATQSLTVSSASRVQWLRGGTSPEAQDVAFELSTNGGTAWTPLGAGTRIPGGWELTGMSLPSSGSLRARARVTGGQYNGSSSLVETLAAFPISSLPSPVLGGMVVLGDGSFRFGFTSPAGTTFTAVAATNLSLPASNWTVLGPVTEISPGQFQFTDPAPATSGRRFYQIRSP